MEKFDRDIALFILELPEGATDKDIKTSYRRLSLRYHPDRNPGDKNAEEMSKWVNAAHQVVSKPNNRVPKDAERDERIKDKISGLKKNVEEEKMRIAAEKKRQAKEEAERRIREEWEKLSLAEQKRLREIDAISEAERLEKMAKKFAKTAGKYSVKMAESYGLFALQYLNIWRKLLGRLTKYASKELIRSANISIKRGSYKRACKNIAKAATVEDKAKFKAAAEKAGRKMEDAKIKAKKAREIDENKFNENMKKDKELVKKMRQSKKAGRENRKRAGKNTNKMAKLLTAAMLKRTNVWRNRQGRAIKKKTNQIVESVQEHIKEKTK
ncbi:MAG: DnaJ domain-containing protein [Rickettsiales bacterium]|jgi:curved DNA-binding protein CbpA|nr:DnaJ domain-containing protein [Rickettsiales bacterium]